ncbi:MAG: alkaline phosphatase family protein [Proteobacteria bacterium]|nr:alkaline phosphatase family protein [Pseudomonadota bacterium]
MRLQAALLLALLFPATGAWAKPPRLMMLGFDGLDWHVLKKCFAKGGCANFRALEKGGGRAVIGSSRFETSSPVIWTTIATGKYFDKHGVRPFQFNPKAQDRRVAALWEILGDAGWRVGVFGYLVSASSRPLNGMKFAAPEWMTNRFESFPEDAIDLKAVLDGLDDAARASVAVKLIGEPCAGFLAGHPKMPWQNLTMEDARSELFNAYVHDEASVRAAEGALARGDLDLAVAYIGGTDLAAHTFLRFWDKRSADVPAEAKAACGGVVLRYYEQADAWLGRLLRFAGADTVVAALSDHGTVIPGDTKEAVNGKHLWAGVFLLQGPPAAPGLSSPIATADVTPTLLYIAGLPVGQDMDGTVRAQLVRPEFATAHPIRMIPTYEKSPIPPPLEDDSPRHREVQERTRQLLKAMGYLDSGQ